MNVIYVEPLSAHLSAPTAKNPQLVITEPLKTAIKTQAHPLLGWQGLDNCVT